MKLHHINEDSVRELLRNSFKRLTLFFSNVERLLLSVIFDLLFIVIPGHKKQIFEA